MKNNGFELNHDHKFDIQLGQSLPHTQKIAELLSGAKLELKTETYQWEQTGRICIEYARDGKPTGVASTDCDLWIHELRGKDGTLVYLMFPIERLKAKAREIYARGPLRDHPELGGYSERGGDGGRTSNVLIPLEEVFK